MYDLYLKKSRNNKTMEETQLDDLDYKIIKHLQSDGRMSFTEIAEDLDVAVSTIRNRYNRIIDEKILRIIGRAEPQKLGLNSYVRVMLAVKPAKKINSVIDTIKDYPEISFLAITSGKFNIELNLMCKNNNALLKRIDAINNTEGVEELQITMYLDVLKWGQ
ncbi:Lrp/AsnC family transcriptional regulator, regulator for asnA, asnC and gidA [Tenacibaculum sp. MAR_2009_124]|uniref:Lrp/AsnC family transcriptional regulator n=1 Tax=Tenacibaculum sp. MAR_2009_124 TaxID=1250059 RepID=UPI00089A4C79|nr:AsnC family transcriptional regulator [Tenacibaculum sp. MAR_2009_124]SEC93738.1 Lrp/AsnC family transcriptional regulator, regulator for asnA, asnC and gidA [Tenacibaculum sp. MAR_2009_124]